MANISLRHIEKIYPGNIKAVHDFNLEIADREFVILVGPSGCGKSTTLRMIAGLESISDGELYIGPHLVNDVAAKNRDIAMVFQNYALYPHMTVFANMAFSLVMRKESKAEIKRKVGEAAELLEITHLLERKPKALSGGQRQRVALGRAMVRHPSAFLLDEPLSNLDAKLRTTMRTVIAKLHKRLGTTFVYVTHDQTEAMTMADRIVVMKNGFIQQVDKPQELYNWPVNKFVAGFIGTPPMNFLSARLERRGGEFVATTCGSDLPLIPERFSRDLLAKYDGRQLTLGVRSEDIHLDPAMMNAPNCVTVNANVDIAEMMGAEIYLYLQKHENNFVSRVSTRFQTNKTNLNFAVDCNNIHLFDPETEENLITVCK